MMGIKCIGIRRIIRWRLCCIGRLRVGALVGWGWCGIMSLLLSYYFYYHYYLECHPSPYDAAHHQQFTQDHWVSYYYYYCYFYYHQNISTQQSTHTLLKIWQSFISTTTHEKIWLVYLFINLWQSFVWIFVMIGVRVWWLMCWLCRLLRGVLLLTIVSLLGLIGGWIGMVSTLFLFFYRFLYINDDDLLV